MNNLYNCTRALTSSFGVKRREQFCKVPAKQGTQSGSGLEFQSPKNETGSATYCAKQLKALVDLQKSG